MLFSPPHLPYVCKDTSKSLTYKLLNKSAQPLTQPFSALRTLPDLTRRSQIKGTFSSVSPGPSTPHPPLHHRPTQSTPPHPHPHLTPTPTPVLRPFPPLEPGDEFQSASLFCFISLRSATSKAGSLAAQRHRTPQEAPQDSPQRSPAGTPKTFSSSTGACVSP